MRLLGLMRQMPACTRYNYALERVSDGVGVKLHISFDIHWVRKSDLSSIDSKLYGSSIHWSLLLVWWLLA